jgi:hypothetical protein
MVTAVVRDSPELKADLARLSNSTVCFRLQTGKA